MIYAQVDVTLQTHPRAIAAGFESMGLWLWGMLYAQLHRTDGTVHRAAALAAWGGRKNIMLAKKLVEVGLWTEDESGNWQIHNYDRKNQSSEDINRRKELARERQERHRSRVSHALHVTPVTRESHVGHADCHSVSHGVTNAADQNKADHNKTERERADVVGHAPAGAPPAKSKRAREPREGAGYTTCPPSDADAATLEAWCAVWKIPPDDPLLPQFLAWHQSRDKRWKDWLAAWRNWKSNETKWRAASGRHVQPTTDRAWTPPEEIT